MQERAEKRMASAGSVFREYWRHSTRYPFFLAFTVIATILIQIGELATPWYLKQFFNTIVRGTPSETTVHLLTVYIVIIASISLAVWAVRRTFGFALMYLETGIMRDLLDSGFARLIEHSYSFFINRFAGSLTHKVNKFSRAYETMVDSIILQFIPTLVFASGAIIILYLQHPVLGIALLLWSIAFLTFQIFVARMRQPLRVKRAERETETTGALADSIGNHGTIQLFSGIAFEKTHLGEFTRRWYDTSIKVWSADEWIWAGLGMFMIVIQVGLLWAATLLWSRGVLTVGDFVLIQAYLLTTFERLVAINRELRRFNDAFADASEMVGLLEEQKEIVDAPNASVLAVKDGVIDLDTVGFYFRFPEDPILSDLSLRIEGRQKVALVGPSGAGKSTITRLLLRLFDVKSGRIVIDGQDIAEVTQESLRDAIAYVPQEPILFHRSLKENIRYGRRDATDEEVFEAAKKAHCHEFIQALPDRYDTYVGERGVKLSGGERQRVAIARAILKDSPILLLDEATSSLDSESEALIQDALQSLMEGKTVIVIAHRLSTIMKMDRIIVLEHGKVVADGTHDELLKSGGLYQKLWSIQAGGFIDDAEIDLEEDDDDDSKERATPVPMK